MFSPGTTVRDMLARYLQLRDWDPVRNLSGGTTQKGGR